jgi:predicted nucleotidyltransferase
MAFINEDFINSEIRMYLESLLSQCSEIDEIWIFGSRSNEKETTNSDWDFLIVVRDDGATLKAIRENGDLKKGALGRKDRIDLFVHSSVDIQDGNYFSPWEEKKINLDDMKWEIWSPETTAEYEGEKGREGATMIWSREDENL